MATTLKKKKVSHRDHVATLREEGGEVVRPPRATWLSISLGVNGGGARV